MPFTPFHMGPGTLIKAALRGSFSLMVFGWAQVLIDLQPLVAIVTGSGPVHGFSHTYLGATLIGLFAACTGKYMADLASQLVDGCGARILTMRLWVAIASGLIGTYSHVALDSIMHLDMSPLAPFSDSNALLGIISVSSLHKFCVYSGLAGAGLYFGVTGVIWLFNRSRKSG